MKNRLARSSIKTTIWLSLRIGTQAIVLVQLTRLFGPRIFGDFTAAASLALVLGMLPTLGAGFIMLARNAHDANGIRNVWRYAWPTTISFGTILLAAYVFLASLISNLPLPTHVLLAIGASELLLTPLTYLASYALQACDMVPLSQFVQWIPLGFRTLAALPCFLLAKPERLVAYVSLQLITASIGVLIALAVVNRFVSLDWRPRFATRQELREGASYAVMNLVAANPSELDKIIALRIVGAHDTGIYATTSRVMASGVTPVIGMLLASQPRLFRHAHTRTREGGRLVRFIALSSLGWGVISGLLLTVCSPILPWLFGAPYAATAHLMPWMAVTAPLLSLRIAAGSVLVAFGKPMERLAFELLGILILVLGMLLLAPFYQTHGLAMALSFAEASMAAAGWFLVSRQLASNTYSTTIKPSNL